VPGATKTRAMLDGMTAVAPSELKSAVEHQLVCKAWLTQSVAVCEVQEGRIVWDGVVHVFDLDYHGDIDRAYAWSDELGDGKRRFVVVEHTGPIDSPEKAVRAAIGQSS